MGGFFLQNDFDLPENGRFFLQNEGIAYLWFDPGITLRVIDIAGLNQ